MRIGSCTVMPTQQGIKLLQRWVTFFQRADAFLALTLRKGIKAALATMRVERWLAVLVLSLAPNISVAVNEYSYEYDFGAALGGYNQSAWSLTRGATCSSLPPFDDPGNKTCGAEPPAEGSRVSSFVWNETTQKCDRHITNANGCVSVFAPVGELIRSLTCTLPQVLNQAGTACVTPPICVPPLTLNSTNDGCKPCDSGYAIAAGQTTCSPLEEVNKTQPPACPCPKEELALGNPIYPLTGSKREPVATGIEIGGIALRLIYDSASKAPGSISAAYSHLPAFGELWFTNLHRKITFSPALKTATLSRGDGRILSFVGSGNGVFTAPANRNETLVPVPGAYRFTDLVQGVQEIYSLSGRLTRLTVASGKTLTFIYDAESLVAIEDSDGKVLQFSYSGTGPERRINQITDTTGRHIAVAYDSAGNLSTLTWQDGKTRQFLYENSSFPWALTGVTDENNSRYATFGYDSAGRAISTEYTGGVGRFSVVYDQAPTVSVVDDYNATSGVLSRTRAWNIPANPVITNPNGETSAIGVVGQFGMPEVASMSQPSGSGSAAASKNMTRDANGNITSQDDFNGKRICYSYDSRNLQTVIVDGLPNTATCSTFLVPGAPLPAGSRKISKQWHSEWSLETKIARPGSITTSVYNGKPDPFNGNSIASCAPAPAATPDGKPIAVLCKQVEQATTDVDGSLGLSAALAAGVSPRVFRFTYDGAGRVLTRTSPLNQVTTYSYYGSTNLSGNTPAPGSFDLAKGAVTLLLRGDGTNGATSFVDSSPVPKPVTPVGAAQISTAQSKFGESIFLNGSAYLTVPNAAQMNFGGDDFTVEAWIRPTAVFPSSGGDRFAIIAAKDSPNSGRSWWFRLYSNETHISLLQFAFGVVGGWEIANGTVAGPTAIPLNQWTHVAATRTGGLLKTFVNGTLAGEAAATRVVTDSNALVTIGGATWPGYEAFFPGYIDDFRITKGYARYTANFSPPTQALSSAGLVLDPTAVGYNTGDLQSITNAAGHVTQFTQYDRAGRVRQMIDPKGVVTDTTYTPRGWIASSTVTPPGGTARTTTFNYDNAGQLTQAVMPDGTTLGYAYDAAHRLTGVTDTKGNTVTYNLDNTGNRLGEQVKDPQGNLQRNITRVYDALNRVQLVTGASN